MYIFNKEDIKIKLHFIKGKQSRSDLQVAVTKSVKKSLWKVDPEKKFCTWLGLTKFKINLVKFSKWV